VDAGRGLVFVRNPNYWCRDRRYRDRLIVKVIPDSSARILALQVGEIDQIHQVSTQLHRHFANDKRFRLVKGVSRFLQTACGWRIRGCAAAL
jgi:ABC-type transport system substrate-binding protein